MSSNSGPNSPSSSQSSLDSPSLHDDEQKQDTVDAAETDLLTGSPEVYVKVGDKIVKLDGQFYSKASLSRACLPRPDEDKVKMETSDTKHRKVGPEIYVKFERQAIKLDGELRKLCNKARKLGSSAGILSASTRLRERLNQVLHAFQKNAKFLYPQKIEAHMLRVPSPLEPVRHGKTDKTLSYRTKMSSITSSDPKALSKALAAEFRLFSEDVTNLLDCFSQFPEFVDELPDLSIAHSLEDFADLVDSYEEDSDPLAVQHFLDNTMGDMGDHLESLAKRFIPFTTIGISTVKASQDHGISNLENQTVVATLFAGIATAMIQVFTSSDIPSSALNAAIVVLWYTCLIFSIGSAVNGLLALSWRQAIYRSPDSHMPWWIRMWIKTFPLAFLVLAVACSFVAIILIGYLSDQSRATLIVTTVLSAISCLGLLAVSGWFMCELLVYAHYEGRIWLVDVVHHRRKELAAKRRPHVWTSIKALVRRRRGEGDYERKDTERQGKPGFEFMLSHSDAHVPFWIEQDKSVMTMPEIAKYRWHEAVRRVIQEIRYQTRQPPSVPSQRFSHLTRLRMHSIRFKTADKLQSMVIVPSDSANEQHTGLVRSLRFSSNGRHLFTSNMRLTDPRSYLLHVESSKILSEMELDIGYFPQIDWSPNSSRLLVRSNRKLTICQLSENEEGKIYQTEKIMEHQPSHDKEHNIRAAAWDGDGSAFYLVKGKTVLTARLKPEDIENTRPKVLHDEAFEELKFPTHHLEIRGLCVTSESPSRWMICSVKYTKDGEEVQSSLQKYGIIIWDLLSRRVARESPVYHKMSDITLACDNRSILISYENRSPSQCWLLHIHEAGTRLILQQSYHVPKVEFAALPSIFGGEYDHLVLRAGKAGDIYAWDRDSAELVHCIKAPSDMLGRELTAFAWNRGFNGRYMFATGTHDGGIQIWRPKADITNDDAAKDVTSESPQAVPFDEPRGSDNLLHRYSTARESFSIDGRTAVSSTSSTIERV